jgi:hypothetical protein
VISSLVFELLDHQWSEPELPDTDCLVADFEATLEEKFRDVSETELLHNTAIKTTSVGNWRSLKGVPVLSLNFRWHARQKKDL